MRGVSRVVWLAIVIGLGLMAFAPSVSATHSGWPSIATAEFEAVWQQADGPVARGEVQRSWLWGPRPIGTASEYYVESTAPGGYRLVQYFDKTRMEETYPDGDKSSPWYVTNGLLVNEMITGRLQSGDNSFDELTPAQIPAAGDLDSQTTPSFADFGNFVTTDGVTNREVDRSGEVVDTVLLRGGTLSTDVSGLPGVQNAYYVSLTGHNIADVFWTSMNDPESPVQQSPLDEDRWVYSMGYPTSEPYWINITLGGVEKTVLIQMFERRVLTYTPDNPAGWQVEMGNVGLQYLEWSKATFAADPQWSPDSSKLAYRSNSWGNMDIYVINADGSGETRVTGGVEDEILGRWLDNGHVTYLSIQTGFWIADASNRSAKPTDKSYPVVSPDGTRFAYVDFDGIHVANLDQSEDVLIPDSEGAFAGYQWSDDGTRLVYSDFVEIDKGLEVLMVKTVNVDGSNTAQVFPKPGTELEWPGFYFIIDMAFSPNGSDIAINVGFEADAQLYTVNSQGGEVELVDLGFPVFGMDWSSANWIVLTGGDGGMWMLQGTDPLTMLPISVPPTFDVDPVWSPDAQKIAFMRRGAIWTVNPFTAEWKEVVPRPHRP